MRRLIVIALIAMFASASAGSVFAHTVSLGYENTAPNALTFWFGSYHTGTTFNEGSFNLVGINGNPFPSTTVPFSLIANTKPVGLIDGTTNSYAPGYGNSSVTVWQGAPFTNLVAGDYQFTYIPLGNPTANWAPIGPSILSGTVTVTQAALSGPTPVPEPSSLAMCAVAACVIGAARRRRGTKSSST